MTKQINNKLSHWKKSFENNVLPNQVKCRLLTIIEKNQLISQGNRIKSGTIFVVEDDWEPSDVWFSQFSGVIILAHGSQISYSSLHNVIISNSVIIEYCSRLSMIFVGSHSTIIQSQIMSYRESSYGLGRYIDVGIETGGRSISFFPEMNLANLKMSDEELPKGYCYIGSHSSINNTKKIVDSYIGDFSTVDCAQVVDNSFILSSKQEPVIISNGSILRNSLVQWGACVTDMAIVEDSALLEHSHVERHGKVFSSVIGPNTGIAEGEVTSSLVGPFVGFHHQSLLIAAWWPEGRGNVAYGANIGSNHTSRMPDQEILPGEGIFFGLDSAVKYPCNFVESPYSIIAFGVTMQPQRVSLPFSLFKHQEEHPHDVRADFNRIIPAWVLSDNIYGVMRNEGKYKKRDKSKRLLWDHRIFRKEIVDKMWIGREKLLKLSGKDVYTYYDDTHLGKNYLLESDRIRAIETYEFYIEYYCLMGYTQAVLEQPGIDWPYQKDLMDRFNWMARGKESNLKRYITILTLIGEHILKSRQKDDRRGEKIIDDYHDTHAPAEEDPFVISFRSRLANEENKISLYLDKKAQTIT
ncbi:DUF4954 family protein [Spirochaeta cellobiosiphila]|uniref:DUF4954 family protein n=1 Tax=Spirochaeta cellobiosiphila TaxID=504483 RepID=UPI0003F7EE54|nr:DUF4954 family protein [Spirochaeta cellobiosiphila]